MFGLNFSGIKGPASQPDQPDRFQDLALGVKRAWRTLPVRAALLVKALDGIGAGGGFAGGAPGVIGEIFQFAVSPPIQPLVAQWFVVAGAIGDPQPTVFPELELAAKAGRLLDDRAKDMRRDRAHSWNALKLRHLPKLSSHSLHFLQRLLPLLQCVIQLSVEPRPSSGVLLRPAVGPDTPGAL